MADIPSAGLAALQGFMDDHGVETEVIYWNLLLHDTLHRYKPASDTTLSPFIHLLAEQANDDSARRRLLSYVKMATPLYRFAEPGDYEELIRGWQKTIGDLFLEKLQNMHLDHVALFGISTKHYQLISGILLAKCVKQLYPGIKIVVGGVDDVLSARAVLRISEDYDFVIWGEGEYPLLKLYEQVTSAQPDLDRVPKLAYRKNGVIVATEADPGPAADLNKVYRRKFDDFFSYAGQVDLSNVTLPIEGSRSCYWGACKFCLMNEG